VDDGVECTVETCDEEFDICASLADHSFCDDGDPCTQDLCTLFGCINDYVYCGACCLADGSCAETTVEACSEALGGSFLYLGSRCLGDGDGNGFDDACEPAAAIPAVSEWGLAILALVLATVGKLYFRHRRDLRIEQG
jgi:hypothetical protein